VDFNPSDATHAEFIHAAVALRASVYGLTLDPKIPAHSRVALASAAASVAVPAFEPRAGVKIAANDKELEEQKAAEKEKEAAGGAASWDTEARAAELAAMLPAPGSASIRGLKVWVLASAVFELIGFACS
jgi:hypothetical protein